MLLDKLKNYDLILASRSPRRRELMDGCGFRYRLADDYRVEEVYPVDLPAAEVPLFLARLKSEGYPHRLDSRDILITADTVVIAGGRVLGKPRGRREAMDMLGVLSGGRHTVVTGVSMRSEDRQETFAATTDVWFRALAADETEYYVDNYNPMDKAGAYGIQEWIGYAAIERIEGSFYNVMGLPVQQLYVKLDKFIG